MEIRTIGIDLGKTVFHLAGVNARGEVVVRKKCSRIQPLRFTSEWAVTQPEQSDRVEIGSILMLLTSATVCCPREQFSVSGGCEQAVGAHWASIHLRPRIVSSRSNTPTTAALPPR